MILTTLSSLTMVVELQFSTNPPLLYPISITIISLTRKDLTCSICSPYSRTFNATPFYKPPSSSLIPFIEFLLLVGDFNIPFLPSNSNHLIALLQSFNLHQHVTSHTSSKLISNYSIRPLFSDLFVILFSLFYPKPIRPSVTRTRRKLTKISFQFYL